MSAVQSQEQTLTGTAAATNDQVSGGFRIESSSDGMIVTKTPYNDLLRLLGFAIVAVFFSFLFKIVESSSSRYCAVLKIFA